MLPSKWSIGMGIMVVVGAAVGVGWGEGWGDVSRQLSDSQWHTSRLGRVCWVDLVIEYCQVFHETVFYAIVHTIIQMDNC